jgi:hypothetical protein
MRDKMFEDIFTGWHVATFKPADFIRTRRLGFLYRNDSESFSNCVFFYSKNKKDLINLVSSMIEKSKNCYIEVISSIDYIVLGTIKERKKETTVYIKKDDIYRIDSKNTIKLINEIDEVPMIYPEESFYIYRVQARFATIYIDS